MKAITILCALILIPGVLLADNQGHGEGRGGGRAAGNPSNVQHAAPRGSGGHAYGQTTKPAVITRMQRYNMPKPEVIHNQSHVVRDNQHITWPKSDGHGAPITQQPARVPPAHHNSVARNTAFVNTIRGRERTETQPRRYYWHDEGGRRYAHYLDHGINWYGFYHGSTFYWTRWYASRWWWYDPRFARWVFWYNGYWWWPGPLGVTYVYMDNSYYPYENGEVVVAHPDVVPPPAQAPNPSAGSTWNSPDGQRMVQITGDQSDAFLYDRSSGQPEYMKYLGPNVDSVRFSGGTNGQLVQILVNYKDGTFALFDENGDSTQTPPTSAADLPGPPPAATPPPQPEDTPPTPAPGSAPADQ